MIESIRDAVTACEWSSAKFLIFSDNVFAPLIYYSHLGVLLITLFFGIFIFLSNRKELANRILFYLSVVISIWLYSDLVLWGSEKMEYIMFFWNVEIIFEPLIYILTLYFFYVLVDKKDLSPKIRILSYSLMLPTLILAPTNFALTGFDLTNCDRVAVEGLLPKYGYAIEILIVLWIVFLAFDRFRKSFDFTQKKQILYTAIGSCLFLFSFSLGNITEVLTENWQIGQVGYIGIPIFIAFLSYQIVKFKLFNIKLLGTQALVVSLWVALCAILFLNTIDNVRVVVSITLILFLIVGMLLIRSVKREVEQREKIEKLAKDLEGANTKLRELDQMKSEFLSLATHQIRAPLTAIKGYSSMLLEGDFGMLPDKAKTSIDTIMKSCQNLINIVGDFLNISRIEQGRMVYEKTEFDIGELTKEVVREIEPNIKNAGLSLTMEIPVNIGATVNADRGKIKQIIGNIIDNSIKYTPKGNIKVSVGVQYTNVLVKVKDTGIGIDPSEMDKLFAKFSRTKDANKTNVIGTGLGLYIAKKMIEAHHGEIKVFSEGVGKGTEFIIELPKST